MALLNMSTVTVTVRSEVICVWLVAHMLFVFYLSHSYGLLFYSKIYVMHLYTLLPILCYESHNTHLVHIHFVLSESVTSSAINLCLCCDLCDRNFMSFLFLTCITCYFVTHFMHYIFSIELLLVPQAQVWELTKRMFLSLEVAWHFADVNSIIETVVNKCAHCNRSGIHACIDSMQIHPSSLDPYTSNWKWSLQCLAFSDPLP